MSKRKVTYYCSDCLHTDKEAVEVVRIKNICEDAYKCRGCGQEWAREDILDRGEITSGFDKEIKGLEQNIEFAKEDCRRYVQGVEKDIIEIEELKKELKCLTNG